MVEMTCLWCEAALRVEFSQVDDEQTCPECLSSWSYEDAPEVAWAVAA